MACVDRPPWPVQTQQLRLGELRLDLRYRRVVHPDAQVELPQRMFDLLLLFAAEPGVLHSRSELLQRVWSGVIVEDANLSQSVWMLRKALGEQRRHWLRTVAKRGYVFEPPEPVEALPVAVVAAGEVVVVVENGGEAIAGAMPVEPSPAVFAAGRHATFRPLIAAMLLLVLGIALVAIVGSRPQASAVPQGVALIAVRDTGAADSAASTALLHAWLEWKLSMLPEVLLLSQAHLATDDPAQDNARVILLSSGTLPGDPARIYLQARFEDGRAPRQLRVEGPSNQLAELVDTLSLRAVERLVPARAGEAWPALRLPPDGGKRYRDLLDARESRQWTRAVDIGRELIAQAPEFGLARLHLAQIYAVLGRVHSAQEQMTAARALLTPLPADAEGLLATQQLALGADHAAAVTAFTELAERYPHQPRLALERARALLRAGRAGDALALLSTPIWQAQPVALRLSQQLARAEAELILGVPDRARASAKAAEGLAQVAGWDYELGLAVLLLAQADAVESRGVLDSTLFEQAAAHFERAGDSMHALRARLLSEIPRAGTETSALDALLAQARAAGQHRLEMDALRTVAYQHYRAGEIDAYRTRLRQAAAVADAVGDQLAQNQFRLDTVNEDFLVGQFDRIDERLPQLRQTMAQGESASWLDQFTALLAFRRGQYEQALAALDQADAGAASHASGAGDVPELMRQCLRGTVLLAQGEPTRARAQYARCRQAKAPVYELNADLGLAQIDLLSGDRDGALERLRSVQQRVAEVPSVPDRWLLALPLAALLTRAGEIDAAEHIYRELRPKLSAANYGQLETAALIGLAENAAARAEWTQAKQHAQRARTRLAADDWALGSRLDLVDVAIGYAAGDTLAAKERLAAIDQQAHRRGDVLVQVQVHGLQDTLAIESLCSAADRAALIASSGLRGASQDWLLGAGPPPVTQIAAETGLY